MKTVVIRTKPVRAITSRIASKKLSTVINKFGKSYVFKNIFEEKMSFQELKKEYIKFMQTGKSEMFAFMDWITPRFGVVIDQQIHLFFRDIDEEVTTVKCFDWEYMEGKRWCGNPLGFKKEEILSDVNTLTMPAFLEKYKRY